MAEEDNNIRKFLRVILAPLQDIENMYQALLTERSIYTAVGAQLDVIGKLVGQLRNALDDDDYRRYLFARVVANKSSGLTEELIKVARLIIDDPAAYIYVQNGGDATVIMRIEDLAVSDELGAILMAFLLVTVAGGVRIIVERSSDDPADWLDFDDDVDTLDEQNMIGAEDGTEP